MQFLNSSNFFDFYLNFSVLKVLLVDLFDSFSKVFEKFHPIKVQRFFVKTS